MIFIASDHAGFELKREIVEHLEKTKTKFKDLGPNILKQGDDYPDFALPLAKKVVSKKGNLGILICRNGIGMTIAANKVKGIRAGLCTFVGQAVTARAHDNCNVLVLASDFLPPEKNLEIVKIFLEAEFSEEKRHLRRIKKVTDFEEGKK